MGTYGMSIFSRACFSILLYLPALAAAQQSAVPAAAAPQSEAASARKDPVLSLRPPPTPESVSGRIQLDVVVTGKPGTPVSGLKQEDFTLLDNKQARKILAFRAFDETVPAAEKPVEVILVLDTVNATFQQSAFARQQTQKFLSQNGGHLPYPFSIGVLTDEGLRIQPRPSTDGNALNTVLDQESAKINAVGSAAGGYGEIGRFQLSVRTLTAVAENEVKKPGRKMVLWIGPGWPTLVGANYAASPLDRQRYFDAIVELSTRLREAHIALYSISPINPAANAGPRTPPATAMPSVSAEAPPSPRAMQGVGDTVNEFSYKDFLKGVKSPRQANSGDLALQVLAVGTGGRVLESSNDMAGQIAVCLPDLSAFYTISFDPPRAEHADEYHDLRVQIGKPGFVARTYTGYYNQP